MASDKKSIPMNTPVCELEWVTISGDGKEDLNGVPHYWVTCIFDPDRVDPENTSEKRAKEHANFLNTLQEFWESEKPAGKIKEIKGGIKDHRVKTDELDEEGDPIWKPSGKKMIVIKTRTEFEKNGEVFSKTVKVLNAQGAKVDLGDTLIGNGSRGRIKFILTTFKVSKGATIMSAGLSFYLNLVQIAKLIPYEGDTMSAIEDDELEEDEAFEGTGEMGGIHSEDDPTPFDTDEASPRI